MTARIAQTIALACGVALMNASPTHAQLSDASLRGRIVDGQARAYRPHCW